MADTRAIIQQYLQGSQVMQLATSHHNEPWVCTVHYVAATDGKLYWVSLRSTRHSQQIAKNKATAATIVHNIEPKQALQLAGHAAEVPADELARIHELYTAKFGPKDKIWDQIMTNTPTGFMYYAFTPTTVEMFDLVNFPTEPKQTVELSGVF